MYYKYKLDSIFFEVVEVIFKLEFNYRKLLFLKLMFVLFLKCGKLCLFLLILWIMLFGCGWLLWLIIFCLFFKILLMLNGSKFEVDVVEGM